MTDYSSSQTCVMTLVSPCPFEARIFPIVYILYQLWISKILSLPLFLLTQLFAPTTWSSEISSRSPNPIDYSQELTEERMHGYFLPPVSWLRHLFVCKSMMT
jgi:hypothetical protein